MITPAPFFRWETWGSECSSSLFKLIQLGRGFKCRFVSLWCLFSFHYACLGLKDLSQIFSSYLFGVVHETLLAWNALVLLIPPGQSSCPQAGGFCCLPALIPLHMCIVLQVDALWSSPPEPLSLGRRNPYLNRLLSPLLSQFLVISPLTCPPWVLHKCLWNSECLNIGMHRCWRS